MAPGRKRGARGPKRNSELSLGDLVLAKVKGFPAWPAKISRPEDWDRAPDPKKYFVQFFGTEEIAFVSPADIQAFTSEARNKLLARCQGKTVKYFAAAVKEICQAFEELQVKVSGGLREIVDKSDLECEAPSADAEEEGGLKDGSSTDVISRETGIKQLGDTSPGLDHLSEKHDELDFRDAESRTLCKTDECFSPILSTTEKKKNALPDDEDHKLKAVVLALSCPKEEVCMDSQEESLIPSMANHANNVEKDGNKYSSLIGKSVQSRDSVTAKKGLTNGHKSERMTSVPKKGPKESLDVHKGGNSIVSESLNSDEHVKESIAGNSVPANSSKEVFFELQQSVNASSEKTSKKLGKRKPFQAAVEGQKGAGRDSEEHAKSAVPHLKKGMQLGSAKHDSESKADSCPAKTAKHVVLTKDASKLVLSHARKHDLQHSKTAEKAENHLAEDYSASKMQTGKTSSHISSDEDDVPSTKRRRRDFEAVSNNDRSVKFPMMKKNETLDADMVKSPANQLHTKRRAVRIYDEDDDERPKTPVHGRSASKVFASAASSAPLKKVDARDEGSAAVQSISKDSSGVDYGPLKERSNSVKQLKESSHYFDQPPDQRPKKVFAVPVSQSPTKSVERVAVKPDKKISISPKKSPLTGGASNRQMSQLTKVDGSLVKVSGAGSQKKHQVAPAKAPGLAPDSLRYWQSFVNREKDEAFSSGVSKSIEHNSTLEVNDFDHVTGSSTKDKPFPVERLEARRDDNMSLSSGSKLSESPMSMKNLIAAAQARRKQAQSQEYHGNANYILAPSVDTPRCLSPASAVQQSLPESSNILHPDVQGYYSNTSKVSPHREFSSNNQPDAEEYEEMRVGSGHQPSTGLLSGGTEAAVARDAFEGMIETLSRTRESIGRATRLAIDCAKYGIANEVVELLIRKLESEPDCHRKVDLFFLVDSITQCSHNHKGIAGASYIPTVQAALPRLLGAAAPPGAATHENRRQCLKVLRLWLERKILPESFLRRYIDGMGVSNEDASAGFFLRRPTRSERAVDDPIREMEGMLVDEYGSNATFQLPGFLSSHAFEEDEEDDVPVPSGAEADVGSPAEELPAAGDSESCKITPNDRRRCILEDVDGELEMEDVSGYPKDERSLRANSSNEYASDHQDLEAIMESDSNKLTPLCEGSPPLPLDSPPPTPPLPPSPPPPPSPPLPPSPSLPPPPPPFSSLQQSLPLPPSDSLPSLIAQSSLPRPLISVQFHLPSSLIPNASPKLSYQPPVAHEHCSTPSGNQFVPTQSNTTYQDHTDASVQGEMYSRQPVPFLPSVINNPGEASGFGSSRPLDYGHPELNVNSQASKPNQHFHAGNAPFSQKQFHPVPPLQSQSSHYVYQNSPAKQLPQQPYPCPYSLLSLPDGPRRYIADEQWRMTANEFKTDNSRRAWMNGGGTPPCSAPVGAPHTQEGYFGPPFERSMMNKIGFQPSTPRTVPAATLVPGHAVSPLMPSRPDMPALNRWRPS